MDYEIVGRGQAARRVLELPEFKSVLEEVNKDLFRQFRTTNVSEADNREDLHKIVYAMDLLVKKLEKYAELGIYEQKRSQPNTSA